MNMNHMHQQEAQNDERNGRGMRHKLYSLKSFFVELLIFLQYIYLYMVYL